MCAVTSLKPLPSAADEQNHGVLHRVEMIISNWSWLCKQDGDGGGGDDVDVGDDRNHEEMEDEGQCGIAYISLLMIKRESEISIQRSSVVGRPTWVNDDM